MVPMLPLNKSAPADSKKGRAEGRRSPSSHSMSSYSTSVGDRESEDSCTEDQAREPAATPAMLWPATPSPTGFVMSQADPFSLVPPAQSIYGFNMSMLAPPVVVHSEARVRLNSFARPFTPAGPECIPQASTDTSSEMEVLTSWAQQSPTVAGEETSVLPSPGSAVHGSGECKPCAWLWKPRGCANATICDYCHLCPEGELKRRKKAKVAALRAGNA
eukprot:CAMPEP_0197642986 /NCGR_PEP_ID=MMETSP1338-20131121/16471_1 /TAXON_ID=43686 ORGANISM="Pelagodinium beii, Strain RCC1491" /NCGR_SAMPLE_ID=MMETSP1338 /ASSEMBLY_ACC=CAM_ASM_000754 /LENGTH=216 /DNA_ID=CAMNT_0043216189 /DNA_START=98 /DNA_END=748 /DNA_ORIENTATION=-